MSKPIRRKSENIQANRQHIPWKGNGGGRRARGSEEEGKTEEEEGPYNVLTFYIQH